MTIADNPLEAYHWEPQPLVEEFLLGLVNEFLNECPAATQLSWKMKADSGTRFFDWIDTITLPNDPATADQMRQLGFVQDGALDHVYLHPGGMFPRVRLSDSPTTQIAVKVESIIDYLAANPQTKAIRIEGEPLANMRLAVIAHSGDAELAVIERHGDRGFKAAPVDAKRAMLRLKHLEAFRTRNRFFATDAEGFAHADKLVDASISDLGVNLTCDLFFAAEREYWMRRNRAAQFQYARQGKLGLGWANHDHHTYRSSRANFQPLVALWEKLGLVCRERFYAGRQAGWGAQVMEQPVTGIITFNDVDLSPEELQGDFSHDALEPREKLGTVGLWCALHGEAFLQSGMHHLECQFDFESLRQQMEQQANVKVMKPFTNFAYLRQAFTEGERWQVDDTRVDRLVARGLITADQGVTFKKDGAIGSHLENLERNQGFKGFNQEGVSEIISATDPRKQSGH